VNLRGVIHGCQAAYPVMMEQGHGQILNVASLAGLIPTFGQMAPYATTKYAVVGLSQALRAAGADHGIKVTALCPGWIDTPILDGAWPEDLPIPPSVANSPTMRESLASTGERIYPADRLAEDTLRGLEHDKPILVIPREWHRMWVLSRLLPGLVMRKVTQITRAKRQQGARTEPTPSTQRA
jgi:short-subunit dehydrogenase